jgi:excisionase family DNA binding protein
VPDVYAKLSDLPELAKVAEVAKFLRCSTDSVYAAVASGELAPVARLGRVLRIPRSTVARWAGLDDRGSDPR